MAGELDYRVYHGATCAEVSARFDDDIVGARSLEGYGYTGTVAELSRIDVWEDAQLPTIRDAVDRIGKRHRKWEEGMAVSFIGGWVVGGWCSA